MVQRVFRNLAFKRKLREHLLLFDYIKMLRKYNQKVLYLDISSFRLLTETNLLDSIKKHLNYEEELQIFFNDNNECRVIDNTKPGSMSPIPQWVKSVNYIKVNDKIANGSIHIGISSFNYLLTKVKMGIISRGLN